MDNIKVQANFISCSENHAVAVGAYGQLYVWGKNFYDKYSQANLINHIDSSESFENSSQHEDENSQEKDLLYYQLGFMDNDVEYLEKPIYYSFNHPLYRVNATQVCCGINFTAVVAKEKPNVLIDEDFDDEYFAKEIDDNLPEIPPYNASEEEIKEYSNILLSNRIRKEITSFLQSKKIEFMKYFKSRIIKESTFIDLMRTEINSKVTVDEIRTFISYKKMRLPGKGISLKPLYELVIRCKQGSGVLFLLGRKDLIIPKKHGILSAELIRDFTLGYYLITLPESVSCAKVCCGIDFVLILSFEGCVFSWGSKGSAALGKNRSPTCLQIKQVPGLVTERVYVKDISCGFNHCLALMSSGILMTWGNGDYGKLGTGRLENNSRPESVGGDLGDIEFIKAGANSSFCKCKGGNYFTWGEANDSKFNNDLCPRGFFEKPEQLSFNFTIMDIAIGRNYCVYVDSYGFLHQIGKGTRVCLNKKHKALEGTSFYQVSGAGNNFFALSTKGSIYSWALEKECDILGRDDGIAIDWPQEIASCSQQFPIKDVDEEVNEEQTVKESSTKIVKVYCQDENTMLLTDKGEVIASGNNKYGQMGIAYGDLEEFSEDNTVYSIFTLIPRLSMAFKTCITSMACGSQHVLAICKDGRLLSWGGNSYGQLGNKCLSFAQQFPEIVTSLKSANIVQAAAGTNHSLVLTDKGEVFSFGCAENGKLGLGVLKASVVVSTPTKIEELNDIVLISCGAGHSLAINKKKSLFLWGSGWKGQIGNGKKSTEHDPIILLINHEWEFATCGATHTLAINTDKKILHWGEVCFPDEESEILQPTMVKGLEDIRFKKAFASDCHSAALVENGLAVYCWGKQMHKRIATAKSEANDKDLCKPITLSIPGEKVSHFALGQFHGVLVTDQGNVFTWGYTYGGRTGEATDTNKRTKTYTGKPTDLSRYLSKGDKTEMAIKENNIDIQLMLQNEPDELNELNIREVDKQIAYKFNDCIDKFVELTTFDKDQEKFFTKVEHKMLTRLQQEPFKCQLMSQDQGLYENIENRNIFYSSLVTTFQVHVCYMFKLLALKLEERRKIEMLNLIYCDMEKDYRLIYTSIYLSRMLLNNLLEKEDARYPEIFQDPDAEVYKCLINKIIFASDVDMGKIRSLAEIVIQSLGNVVQNDENGIDPNPLSCQKNAPSNVTKISNKITAYQISRNIVDRRMSKLRQLMQYFIEAFRKFVREEEFSEIVTIITKDFIQKCTKKFDLKLKKFDHQIDSVLVTAHTILSLILKPLCDVVQNPQDFYVIVENKEACSRENLDSISDSLRSFFSGIKLGEANERWYLDINNFNTKNEQNLSYKVQLLESILKKKT